ncbi:tRNA 2-selenouridine(34) synthase MnmH [Haliscomenobacter hydrossis]|uniref:tRNA 2-selenouridine synthase n=1 Tax=Haliscomenobacter hydrossis (strain ATCC 27775 / DSM 1100 / LMG 10767 / O) TaxID=760192 RepID=F4KW01_HALH1|nr:tRNA 2-selenouridine(34) synthase MnmH [Haliscomenobacter hydrossis]AEE48199.1 tRNA 2-selenouridine synthase [Haliscomenobacter hydrossis DSM 1100]
MDLKIAPESLSNALKDRVLLDVRTPAEFAIGHIPGAYNLPLFSDEERVVVGTMYKQQSPDKAFLKGLEYAGARMPDYVKEARLLAPRGKVVVHCWRGGQRSGSLSWLLGFSGMDVMTLQGGYKAYRQFIHQEFARYQLRMLVLGGPTGSAKTKTLHALAALGEQIIDLEQLAQHKGSAFGDLGEAPQPSVEQFENNLYAVFSLIDPQRRVWVENESRGIGRVFMPQGFWDQFRQSPLLDLEIPFDQRVAFLVATYASFDKDALRTAFMNIERRLGGLNLKNALAALQADDFATAAEIALRYYDKSYLHANQKCNFHPVWTFPGANESLHERAQQLIQFADAQQL